MTTHVMTRYYKIFDIPIISQSKIFQRWKSFPKTKAYKKQYNYRINARIRKLQNLFWRGGRRRSGFGKGRKVNFLIPEYKFNHRITTYTDLT